MAKRKRATLISWIMYYTMSQMEVCWAYDMCFLILESMAPSCFHLPSSPSSWSFTLDDVRENPADIVGFCCSFLPLIFCVVFLTVYGFPPWSSVVLRGPPWSSVVVHGCPWSLFAFTGTQETGSCPSVAENVVNRIVRKRKQISLPTN